MENISNSIPILEFDGIDYEYWSIWMMTLLEGKDLWDVVEVGYTKPTDWSVLSKDKKKNLKR